MNLSLFERPAPASAPPAVELRPYQIDACTRIEESWLGARSTLIVMATGTGKTTVFSETLRRRRGAGRSLVLAHRDELIRQAAKRIGKQTGLGVEVEKAEEYAGRTADVVVASVQTLSKEMRLSRWSPDHFSTIVVDEAHHAVADTYRRILGHFEAAKVLGVTATPDRADEMAMGQVFEDVAFVYEIGDAIADGWLCPIRATSVWCDAVDLAGVKTVAGDLSASDLETVMATEAALHQVAKPTIELAGARRTIVFTTSVANAHRLAEVFNRYRPECARAVDGGTDPLERRRILSEHQQGRYQFLCNVGVLTEGYDDPLVSCVAMGRPTKSRALYAQMAGRGTRTAPGKTDLLLLDFVGNAGKHALASAVDILGGKYSDEAMAQAKEAVAKEPGQDIREALDEAERELRLAAERKRAAEEAMRRQRAKANVAYQAVEIDPFRVLGVRDPGEYSSRFGDEPPTEGQLSLLTKWKIPAPQGLTKRGASRLIGTTIKRREDGLCTFAQAKVLQKRGYDTTRLTFEAARGLMDALAANNWRPLSAEAEARAMARELGAEG